MFGPAGQPSLAEDYSALWQPDRRSCRSPTLMSAVLKSNLLSPILQPGEHVTCIMAFLNGSTMLPAPMGTLHGHSM